MAFSVPKTKPLSTCKLLREAFKLPTRNSSLILPILLLSFLTSALLLVSSTCSLNPILSDLTAKAIYFASLNPKSPEYAATQAAIFEDSKAIFGLEGVFVAASFVVYTLTGVALIYAFSLAYSGELLPIKNFPGGLARRLKGPVVTELYVWAFNLGYVSLLLATVTILVLVGKSSVVSIVSAVVLILLGFILYLYLTMVWSVGLVVSVVEEGCYGFAAVAKAAEIVNGRARQGLLFMLVDAVITGVLYVAYKMAEGSVSPSSMVTTVVGLVHMVLAVLMAAFGWALVFVFYHDCKSSRGEGEVALGGGFMYGSLPTSASLDEA